MKREVDLKLKPSQGKFSRKDFFLQKEAFPIKVDHKLKPGRFISLNEVDHKLKPGLVSGPTRFCLVRTSISGCRQKSLVSAILSRRHWERGICIQYPKLTFEFATILRQFYAPSV